MSSVTQLLHEASQILAMVRQRIAQRRAIITSDDKLVADILQIEVRGIQDAYTAAPNGIAAAADSMVNVEASAAPFPDTNASEVMDTPPSPPVPRPIYGQRGSRRMSGCFRNGQRIRHKCMGIDDTIIGTYDSACDKIFFEGNHLSLNQFALRHYVSTRPDRTSSVNAWWECQCQLENGTWISTYNLSSIN